MLIDFHSICDPRYIKAEFPKYVKPYECSTHLKITLNEFPNLATYKRECVVNGELCDMINLEGTVSVAYKGNTYNIPLRVILGEDYPATAPILYVKPTENMILGKNVPYLNSRGKISAPYLENWDKENHPDLYKMLHALCILFADNPPVWTKRTNSIVKVYESKSLKVKHKDARLTGLKTETEAGATKEALRQGQGSFTSRVANSKERIVPDTQGDKPKKSSESLHSISPSTLDTESKLPKFVMDDLLDGAHDSRQYRSVAYADSPSSSRSSSAKSTPSPSQASFDGVFVPIDVGPDVPSPGSFVPASTNVNNNSTNDNNDMEPSPPSKAEGTLSKSQSVPSNLSRQKPCNVLTTYKRRKLIGSGGFAKVYLYENEKTRDKVACKVVDLGANDEHVQKCSEALKKEIKILCTLSHEFIISYLSTEEHNNNFAMIMDYFPKGSLYSELQRRPDKCFDEPTTRFFTWQIIQGVKYLHQNAVIHKDIKARNILIDDSNIIKIADFGISKKMGDLKTVTTASEDHFASLYWQSPEYLSNEKYGRKTDVWSVGCTVVEMLVGEPPLLCEKITNAAAGMRILQGKVYPPENCSAIAKEFLEHCFRLADERPTASELMEKTEFPACSV